MIGVKEAVARAIEYAQTVLEPPRRLNPLLEEVEIGTRNGREVWFITLSIPRRANIDSILANLSNDYTGPREYKTFTVDGETGEVISMKIREVAGA